MRQPFDWDLLQSFLAVARTGKLTGAARRLKIDHSTLSRRLTVIETALGVKLFKRQLSGYTLTSEGEDLLPRAEAIESTVLGIQSDVAHSNLRVSGAVRVSAPDGFGSIFLAPLLPRLLDAHPDLEVELTAMPRSFSLSLSKHETDIAVGLSRPTHGRVHSRKLTDYELGVYAAVDYQELWGPIKSAEDFAARPFIGYIDDLIFAPELNYVSLIVKSVTPRIRSSNIIAQMEATAVGAGLCILPCFLADLDLRLVRLLPGKVHLIRTLWMVVNSDMRDLARIRLTSDFIAKEIRQARHRFLPRRRH